MESGFEASVLGTVTGRARTAQYVRAGQVRVVQIPARRCRQQQGQAEEGNENREEVRRNDVPQERGRELVSGTPSGHTTLDTINEEVEFEKSDDEGMEDQAAAEASRDQRRNRRHGRAISPEEVRPLRRLGRVFSTEDAQSVQSFLPPSPPDPASSEDDQEETAPSDS